MDERIPSLVLITDGDSLRFEFGGRDSEPIKLETGQNVPVYVVTGRGGEPVRLALAFWSRDPEGRQPWVSPVSDEIDRLLRGHATEFEKTRKEGVWQVARPSFLPILHPGHFAFVAQLVFEDGRGRRRTVKLDPDVEVRGGYPPHG